MEVNSIKKELIKINSTRENKSNNLCDIGKLSVYEREAKVHMDNHDILVKIQHNIDTLLEYPVSMH